MFYIYGKENIIARLNKAFRFNIHNKDWTHLHFQKAYWYFLQRESTYTQQHFQHNIQVIDFLALEQICPKFCDDFKLHFTQNSPVLQDRLKSGFFIEALAQMELQHAEIYSLAQTLIKIILVNHCAAYINGTTRQTLGISFFDFKDHYTTQDFIELIVHQMTHMLLFIDDTIHMQMLSDQNNTMIEVGLNYVRGGTQFPAYLAFHSFIVGVEVLAFRLSTLGAHYVGNYHGTSQKIINICSQFRKSLLDHFDLFTSYGQTTLNNACLLFENLCKEC